MPARFVHLHLHTEFSLADSTIRSRRNRIRRDPKKAKQAQPAQPRGGAAGCRRWRSPTSTTCSRWSSSTRPPKARASSRSPAPTSALADGNEAPSRLTLLCRDHDGYLTPVAPAHAAPGWKATATTAWRCARNGCARTTPGLFALAGRDSLAGRLAAGGRHDLAEALAGRLAAACSATACTWN